jgi:hypothetical protein
MTDNSLTLALEGDVTVDQLQTAIAGLRDLLSALSEEIGETERSRLRVTLGAVKGRVQAMSSRGELRFVLFDALTD